MKNEPSLLGIDLIRFDGVRYRDPPFKSVGVLSVENTDFRPLGVEMTLRFTIERCPVNHWETPIGAYKKDGGPI